MHDHAATCPMTRPAAIDTYFMEHRAKVLDIAAFLDRLDRARSTGEADEDFRITALQEAIKVLIDGKGERARRVLELFSDPTVEPLESAAGMKGAAGAWPGGIPGRDGAPPVPEEV